MKPADVIIGAPATARRFARVRTRTGRYVHLVPLTSDVIEQDPRAARFLRARSEPAYLNVAGGVDGFWKREAQGAVEWDSETFCKIEWWSMMTPVDEDDLSRLGDVGTCPRCWRML